MNQPKKTKMLYSVSYKNRVLYVMYIPSDDNDRTRSLAIRPLTNQHNVDLAKEEGSWSWNFPSLNIHIIKFGIHSVSTHTLVNNLFRALRIQNMDKFNAFRDITAIRLLTLPLNRIHRNEMLPYIVHMWMGAWLLWDAGMNFECLSISTRFRESKGTLNIEYTGFTDP